MKKLLATSALLLATALAGCSRPQPIYVAPPPPPPSLDYHAIEQQGQHDGFDAASHDVHEGRPPVFNHHRFYRNPPVAPPGFQAYRIGFRRGYEQFLHTPLPSPPPGQY